MQAACRAAGARRRIVALPSRKPLPATCCRGAECPDNGSRDGRSCCDRGTRAWDDRLLRPEHDTVDHGICRRLPPARWFATALDRWQPARTRGCQEGVIAQLPADANKSCENCLACAVCSFIAGILRVQGKAENRLGISCPVEPHRHVPLAPADHPLSAST
jgi:hypothetical protein